MQTRILLRLKILWETNFVDDIILQRNISFDSSTSITIRDEDDKKKISERSTKDCLWLIPGELEM